MSDCSADVILRNIKAALGDQFNPNMTYSLLNDRHDGGLIAERVQQGWQIIRSDVPGASGNERFTLLGKLQT